MPQVIGKSAVVVATITGLVAYGASIGAFGSGTTSVVGAVAGIGYPEGLYLQRFVASALFLGIVPFTVALIFRIRPANIGFRPPVRFTGVYWFAGMVVAGFVIGLVGSFSSELRCFYPYRSDLADLVLERGAGSFLIHATLYLVLYYIPWELAFRGVFVVLTTESLVIEEDRFMSTAFLIAMLQAAPSAIIHFGHPLSEVFGAIVFGIVFGYVTLVSRSILPALLVHASAGISLDLFIVLRGVG